MKENEATPFKAFGERIKFLRKQWKQTITEVCDTLEINQKTLTSIEAGKFLPEIDTLDMLINHFLLTDDQAEDLKNLAELGFDQNGVPLGTKPAIEDIISKQMVMFMPIDNKIVYTDGMHANVNDHGVTLQFMQHVPGNDQPIAVSRVGMSREHAERVVKVLQQTLKQYDTNKKPKLLPAPESKDSKKTES